MERGTIFKNEHETNGEKWYSYNFSKSGKDKDGNKVYASIPIKFVKGATPPEHKAYIEIKEMFLSPIPFGKDEKGNKKSVMGIICSQYEELITKEQYDSEPSGFSQLESEDIPF